MAIDVTAAITGGTGIARYVTALSDTLASTPDVEVVRFALGRAAREAPPDTRHVRVPLRVLDAWWRAVAHPTVERLVGPVDTLHASGPTLPPSRSPAVAVVHDLAPLQHPDLHPARDVAQLRRYIDRLGHADAIIAVSSTTADRLAGAGAPSERVRVVHNGVTEFPDPVTPALSGRPYVLAVGAPVARKDFATLVRSMARLRDFDLALAIVGPPGPEDAPLAELAGSLGVTERLHRAGPVTDAELAGWYRDAAVLAAPSVEEGFGLTLVEAMAAGTPVVATDIEIFREVTAGCATLVPVGDADALADALLEAVEPTAAVEARRSDGVAAAAAYSWAACGAATLEVHRSVAGR